MMEMSRELDAFDVHAIEWQVEPMSDNENSTAIMCPGAEGWREYWQEKLDVIIEKYGFDGFYIDLRQDPL